MLDTKPWLGLFSSLEPDPMSVILKTDFLRFKSQFQIEGLMRGTPDKLEILALVSTNEGKGHLSLFIEQAKKVCSSIYIWEIFNPALEIILKRHGFIPITQTESDGEIITGMSYTKPLVNEI